MTEEELWEVVMKWIPIALLVGLMAVTCSCTSGPRRLIGTNVVGADVATARENTSTLIQTEIVQGNIESIEQDAQVVSREAQVEAVAAKGHEIEKRAKESGLLLKDIHGNLESIHHRSLGKTYWSKGRLLLVWLVGFVVLGIAVRFIPFFSPINRAVSGIAHAVMDVIGGMYSELRDVQIEHLSKTDTIPTANMSSGVQIEIKKAEIKKLRNGS